MPVNTRPSKHKTLSYGHAEKIEQQLKAEVQALTAQAESADLTQVNEGMDIPQEIARREDRLKVLADTGYFSERNVRACLGSKIKPLIAGRRAQHNLSVVEHFAPDSPVPETENPVPRMKHQLGTQAGRALYGLRKQTVAPVFGVIRQVMGFRQFSMRGVKKAAGEWTLVTLAWNVKRLNLLRRCK